MDSYHKAMKGCLRVLKHQKGLHRDPLMAQYHFDGNTLDKRLKDIDKLSVRELNNLDVMYLENTQPGIERVKALLDLKALFLYESEEMKLLYPDGGALFKEHPRKILEDYIANEIQKKLNG